MKSDRFAGSVSLNPRKVRQWAGGGSLNALSIYQRLAMEVGRENEAGRGENSGLGPRSRVPPGIRLEKICLRLYRVPLFLGGEGLWRPRMAALILLYKGWDHTLVFEETIGFKAAFGGKRKTNDL